MDICALTLLAWLVQQLSTFPKREMTYYSKEAQVFFVSHFRLMVIIIVYANSHYWWIVCHLATAFFSHFPKMGTIADFPAFFTTAHFQPMPHVFRTSFSLQSTQIGKPLRLLEHKSCGSNQERLLFSLPSLTPGATIREPATNLREYDIRSVNIPLCGRRMEERANLFHFKTWC